MKNFKTAADQIADEMFDREVAPTHWQACQKGAEAALEEADADRSLTILKWVGGCVVLAIVLFTVHHLVAAVAEMFL